MSWNVQYGAGRRQRFFYDGGSAVHATPSDVQATLDGIAALIDAEQPDLVLLQEVDRDSARTQRVDQLAALQARLQKPYSHIATATYHRVPYVPFPPHRHLGRVHLDLVALSRLPITAHQRHALPRLRESWLRQQFNLKRCAHELTLDWTGRPLTVINTHLSAFSGGDGTLTRQVDALVAVSARSHGPLLLAGDLNLLPLGDDPARLGRDADQYADDPNPITALHRALSPVLPVCGTWVPWGSLQPERALDHAFSRSVRAGDARALPSGALWSDHLPLCFTVEPE